MNSAEMVTDFVIHEHRPDPNPERKGYLIFVQRAKIVDLIRALNKYCGKLAEEYPFSQSPMLLNNPMERIPEHRWLVAFVVEGDSEGYYIHITAMLKGGGQHQEIALAKTYSAESAYKLATEAQRFLTAAAWN